MVILLGRRMEGLLLGRRIYVGPRVRSTSGEATQNESHQEIYSIQLTMTVGLECILFKHPLLDLTAGNVPLSLRDGSCLDCSQFCMILRIF